MKTYGQKLHKNIVNILISLYYIKFGKPIMLNINTHIYNKRSKVLIKFYQNI